MKRITLRALLKTPFVPDVTGEGVGSGYRFCETQGCDVVYFGRGQWFSTAQLKVAVGVKLSSGERPLCYCFGHSIDSIKRDLREMGRTNCEAQIRAQMQDPGCRCETENPSGSCCLGSVRKGIATAEAEVRAEGLEAATFRSGRSTGSGDQVT